MRGSLRVAVHSTFPPPSIHVFKFLATLHGRTPQNHTPRQPFSTFFWKISRLRTEALLMDTSDACSTLWPMPANTGCSESTTAYYRTHASSACSALDLPLTEGWRRCALSDAELSHLAVSWNIWATFPRECGALRPECLYLIWDGADHTRAHAPPPRSHTSWFSPSTHPRISGTPRRAPRGAYYTSALPAPRAPDNVMRGALSLVLLLSVPTSSRHLLLYRPLHPLLFRRPILPPPVIVFPPSTTPSPPAASLPASHIHISH
ncbi:hypothetical protein C8J57DRAFT_1673450 [Mycena rebaudengoi]|nr:hypothetical protein C8J57DRAFT_1673450 [Mycena rebaudengoi]